MTLHEDMRVLATALGMTPTKRLFVVRDVATKEWWLTGCKEGDKRLPRSRHCATAPEAVQTAIDWLAPEVDAILEEEKG